MSALPLQIRPDRSERISRAGEHLVIDAVCKTYASERGSVEALRNVNFSIREGDFVSIVGPSGCGKSTLLRCIAGLEQATSGRILKKGEPITAPPENTGMVFQRDVLLQWRSVLDNVLLMTEFRGKRRRDWVDRARALLDVFGLASFHDRYPWELSGGMRQRVSICRAMLDEPELLLMDEPFAALDAFTRDELNLELQESSRRTRSTTVFITHNISEAIFLADQVVVMDRRPGQVALALDIDIPRPRSLAVRESRDFADYGRVVRRTFEELGILRSAS